MRTTVTIPDEYYNRIKLMFAKEGYTSINEMILDMIRKHYHQSDVPTHQIDVPATIALGNFPPLPHQSDARTPSSQHQIDVPDDLVVPRGMRLTGKKKACPYCGEVVAVELANQHYMNKHGDME